MELKTLLVPYDFSPCAIRAFDAAVALSRRFGATIVLLHVVPPGAAVPVQALGAPFGVALPVIPLADLVVARQQELDAILEPLVKEGGSARSAVVVDDVVDAIRAAATKEEADLVVVGTHGRTGLGHFLFGSVAEELVRTLDVPVLSLREPAES